MKVLYATRLFTGLESSVAQRRWAPTGVPTIHKVIEALDRRCDLNIVLASKDPRKSSGGVTGRTIALEGLRAPVTVLGGASLVPRALGRAQGAMREATQTARIVSIARRTRPDLVYVDHANILAGAVLARTTRLPVLFRVMGVYPSMRQSLGSKDPAARLMRWAYRSPFAFALCTEDGSGVRPWLKAALAPDVERAVMINGVDLPEASSSAGELPIAWPQARTVVLFVGKLEREKGCEEFVESFLQARQVAGGGLHALIVGTGSLRDRIRTRVAQSGAADDATFIDRVPHAAILEIQRRADVYVSLNRLGNLSNANLEAMRVGAAMILPARLPDIGQDDPTAELLPPGTFLSIPEPSATTALAEAILSLHADPERRRALGRSMRQAAETLIPSWEARIARELALLERLAGRERRA